MQNFDARTLPQEHRSSEPIKLNRIDRVTRIHRRPELLHVNRYRHERFRPKTARSRSRHIKIKRTLITRNSEKCIFCKRTRDIKPSIPGPTADGTFHRSILCSFGGIQSQNHSIYVSDIYSAYRSQALNVECLTCVHIQRLYVPVRIFWAYDEP